MFSVAFSILAGLINGAFASGGGMIALPMLSKELKNEKQAYSSVCLFVLPLSLLSIAIGEKMPDKNAVFVCIGAFFGGIAGAYLNEKMRLKYIKTAFALVVIYTGVSMLI